MRKSLGCLSLAATLLVTLASPLPASASRLEEFVLYPFVQHFNWEEFDSRGNRLLEESGPLFGVGTLLRVDLRDGRLMLQAKGEIFGGNVDYDGQTQSTTDVTKDRRPAKTDVDYVGTRIEGDLGVRIGDETKGSVEPFLGLGYRYWIRDINDTVAVSTTNMLFSVAGYTEKWQSLYTRWGLRGAYTFDEDFKFFAEAGGKYPIYNENSVDYFSDGDVTIKPGKQFSPFAEAGFRIDRFRASIFYEGFRFSESPSVFAGFDSSGRAISLRQPKSESDIIGVTLGWCFK